MKKINNVYRGEDPQEQRELEMKRFENRHKLEDPQLVAKTLKEIEKGEQLTL